MTPKLWIVTFTGALVLASGSCDAVCACSFPAPEKHVVGFVMQGNSPLVGAHIMALFTKADCSTQAPLVNSTGDEDAADPAGRYDFGVSSFEPALCARLVAHSGTDSIVRDSIGIDMLTAPDTVRVDLNFP